MGEGLVVLAAILLGATLPILPVQILWINMTTAVALGSDAGVRAEGGRHHDPATARPARTAAQPALVDTDPARVRGAGRPGRGGSSTGSSPMAPPSQRGANRRRQPLRGGRGLLPVQLPQPERVGLGIGWLSNRWVIGGIAVQVVGQLALTYLPVMHTALRHRSRWTPRRGCGSSPSACCPGWW